MRKNLAILISILFVGFLMFAACSSDKGPAELAIKGAEEALNASKAEAMKYVPDQVKAVEDALAAAKDKMAKKEYKAALEEAKGIPDKVKGLAEAINAKKEELAKSWNELSEGVPKMVEAIQSRVDILSKSKKLPANLTSEKFEAAKSGLATAKEDWAKALETFKAGNLIDSVAVANSVKDKAKAAMEALGMEVPEAAK